MLKLGLAALALAVSPPAIAQDADTVAHPELSADRLLPPIMAALRVELPDVDSVKDLVLCRPEALKFKNSRLTGWRVYLSFNAKNAFGGYTGTQMYGAIFREGKRVDLAHTQMANNEGFNGIINRAIAKDLDGCPYVPAEAIQAAILAGGAARALTRGAFWQRPAAPRALAFRRRANHRTSPFRLPRRP